MIAIIEAGSYTELMNLHMDEFFEVRSAIGDIADKRKRAMSKNA
jgi:hypothetical protein